MLTEILELTRTEGDESFNDQKRRYFIKLGLGVRGALKMHKRSGLWCKDEEDWRNVSEHCLVTAARVSLLANTLGFSKDEQDNLIIASALHDFFKRDEIRTFKTAGTTWENMRQSSERATRVLAEAGFNKRIVNIINFIGLGGTPKAIDTLHRSNFSQGDLASLLPRYVDMYTIGSEWVEPEVSTKDSNTSPINVRANKDILKYSGLYGNEEVYFPEESIYDVFCRNGHDIARRILDFLQASGINHDMQPKELPYWIDSELKKRIKSQ